MQLKITLEVQEPGETVFVETFYNPGISALVRGVEHAGEVGEAIEQIAAQIEKALTALDHVASSGKVANIVKKRVREDRGIRGSRASLADLGDELADDVITAYLVAMKYEIDLDAAIEHKFNSTSEKMGLHVFLDLTSNRKD
jgi:NTP pyrophosphatase (non-canonical NTP hydrolase)